MSILVFNAGSSSLKFGLFDADARDSLASGAIDWADGDRSRARMEMDIAAAGQVGDEVDVPSDRAAALQAAAAALALCDAGLSPPITTVAHRVVYGGAEFFEHVLIEAKSLQDRSCRCRPSW